MLLSPNHPKTKREPVGLSKQVLQKTELISNVFEERFNCQRINKYRLFSLSVQSPIRCNFPFSPSDCFSLPYREPYCETSTIHNPAYGWGGKKKQNLRQTKNRFIPGNTLFGPYFKIATNKDPFCQIYYKRIWREYNFCHQLLSTPINNFVTNLFDESWFRYQISVSFLLCHLLQIIKQPTIHGRALWKGKTDMSLLKWKKSCCFI